MDIIISGLKNPSYVINSNQNLEIWDENNTLTAQDIIKFQFLQGIILATITSTSNLAGEVSTFTFTFQISNPILQGGYIMIYFPYFNQNSGAKDFEYLSCLSSTTNIELLNKKVNKFNYFKYLIKGDTSKFTDDDIFFTSKTTYPNRKYFPRRRLRAT